MGEILSSNLYIHSKETGISVVTQADQDILNSKSIFVLKLQSTMHAVALWFEDIWRNHILLLTWT